MLKDVSTLINTLQEEYPILTGLKIVLSWLSVRICFYFCHELTHEELNEMASEMLGNVGFSSAVHKSYYNAQLLMITLDGYFWPIRGS